MADNRWLVYALVAALAAALTGIFGKLGISDEINPTVATAVRSAVMCLFLAAVVTAQGLWRNLPTIRGWAIFWIVMTGVAGATSWLFGFKALASPGGLVSRVAPIDKLSVPLAVVLAVVLFRDRPSFVNWAGIVLITLGAYLASIRSAPAPRGVEPIISPTSQSPAK